jgi:hypothetical protein
LNSGLDNRPFWVRRRDFWREPTLAKTSYFMLSPPIEKRRFFAVIHAGPPHMGEGGCMAMEDSLVLAEELSNAMTVESALESYARRRRPRANWVQAQSRAAAQAWVLPLVARNAALRERGDQMFRDRYRPLIPAP